MAASTSQVTASLQDQLLVAVQSVNNGTVDSTDDIKLEPSSAEQQHITTSSGPELNGTTQITSSGLATLMNIQGLTGIPQMATIGLQGLTSLGALGQLGGNVKVSLAPSTSNASIVGTSGNGATTTVVQSQPNISHQANQAALTQVAMPQFILAGGQLIQGIQGAQLFIPTSSGVATQQILTIPINQMASGQMVQLITSNGQLFTTTMNNLQGITQPISVGGVSSTSAGTSEMPTQQIVTGNLQSLTTTGQMTTIPQIITNASGQVVAIGSQLIAQPMVASNQAHGLLQIQSQGGHLCAEKMTVAQVVTSATKAEVQQPTTTQPTVGPTLVQQAQAAQIQIATVGASTQLAQTVQRASAQNAGQVLQVTQSQMAAQQVTTSTSAGDPPTTISQSDANTVDGINLEEIKEFAKAFKIRRLSLGLTQTQVGQALSITEGPAYSQSAICRFEKLDITPKSAQKIKPVLERWMKEAEERYKNGAQNLTEFIGTEPSKKRKRRTSFTPQALEILNQHFERNTHPSGAEMTELAEKLNYDREVVRVWFCNKRQALKNTIKKLKSTP